jgi:hypothetical protein
MARNHRPKSETNAIVAPAATAEQNAEELRLSIMRKLAVFVSDWRRCRRGICQRSRACVPQDGECLSPRGNLRPMTDEQEARARAGLLRALKQRQAELAAAREQGEVSAAAFSSPPPRPRPAPASRGKARGTAPSGSPPSVRR